MSNLSFQDIVTQMNVSKTMAFALPRFFERTGISAEFHFVHDPKIKEMTVTIGFSPKVEQTNELYSILLEEITDAEKLLMNEYIFNSAQNVENLKQYVFKHKEETMQIISKNK